MFMTIKNPVNKMLTMEVYVISGYFNMNKVAIEQGKPISIIEEWLQDESATQCIGNCILSYGIEKEKCFFTVVDGGPHDGFYAHPSIYDYFMIWIDSTYLMRLGEFMNKLDIKNRILTQKNKELEADNKILYDNVFNDIEVMNKTQRQLHKMKKKVNKYKTKLRKMVKSL